MVVGILVIIHRVITLRKQMVRVNFHAHEICKFRSDLGLFDSKVEQEKKWHTVVNK